MKRVKLPGNDHFSLVEEENEEKVVCDLFPYPQEDYAQIPGEEDVARADMLPLDVKRWHIIHTLAGPHFLPVEFGAQSTAVVCVCVCACITLSPGGFSWLAQSQWRALLRGY